VEGIPEDGLIQLADCVLGSGDAYVALQLAFHMNGCEPDDQQLDKWLQLSDMVVMEGVGACVGFDKVLQKAASVPPNDTVATVRSARLMLACSKLTNRGLITSDQMELLVVGAATLMRDNAEGDYSLDHDLELQMLMNVVRSTLGMPEEQARWIHRLIALGDHYDKYQGAFGRFYLGYNHRLLPMLLYGARYFCDQFALDDAIMILAYCWGLKPYF
jgi:hypothetical protein